jgi:acyl dehydratase
MTDWYPADAKVGDELPKLTLPPITRLQLALYCGGSGDHNPIHVDSDFAKRAGRADVIAHGMLSMAFMGRTLNSVVPQSKVRSLSVRFVAPTLVGDELTVSGRVAEVDTLLRRILLNVTCANQRGEVTLTGRAVLSAE